MSTEVMIQIFESDFTNDGLVQTVNARDLHEALGVKRDFTNWIKYQLEDFKENQDFIIFAKNGEKSRGRPTQDYAITLDCAKHICMMSRCEKGKQLRQYFIEAEKQFRLGLDQQPQAQPQVGYTPQPQQQSQELIPGTPEHFAACYRAYFGEPVLPSLTVQQQHTEPVVDSAVPHWGAVHTSALPHGEAVQAVQPPEPERKHYYNPHPSHKISKKGLMRYVSSEALIDFLIKKFNIKGEDHDYGYITGNRVKTKIYNKQKMLAILHAACVLSSPLNDKQRVFAGVRFTIKQEIKPEMYDSEAFDNAYDNLKEELNHH